MNIIIFIIILSVLVFVHEAGHFIAAKSFGVRVDEFGFGYPPRAKSLFIWKGTEFTLNWLPFGGFVKIFGEDPSEEASRSKDSFVTKNRLKQAIILVAGVFANFLIAGVFMSAGFMMGMPASPDGGLPVSNIHTSITEVLPGSPAETAGLKPGDNVLLITRGDTQVGGVSALDPATAAEFISHSTDPVQITVKRGDTLFTKSVTPAEGLIAGKPAIGFGLSELGTAKLGFFSAIYYGFRSTIILTGQTAAALWHLISQAFVGHADLSQVTGPVGLVSQVGAVAALGFVYILSFAALISINLSLVNLLPFPALDGGRLLFVAIEAIIRRPIPARVANTLNTVGFALLVLLMILITVRDVSHLI